MISIEHALQWVYPYTLLLGHEGKMAVEGVLKVSICFPFLSVTSGIRLRPQQPKGRIASGVTQR